MAAIFEAPATHEAVHEAAQEWEWEHHEGAHQPESHEWEAGMESHEWEGSHEWESPSGEWESHEWESHEWEVSPEWEADPFIGKAFKAIGRGIGHVAVHEFAHQILNTSAVHNKEDEHSYEYPSPDRSSQYYGDLHWTTARPFLEQKLR